MCEHRTNLLNNCFNFYNYCKKKKIISDSINTKYLFDIDWPEGESPVKSVNILAADRLVDSIIETAKDLGSLEVLIELYDIYSNGSIDFQSEYKEGIDAIDLSSLSTLVEEIKSEKDEAENESTQPSEDDQAIGMERQDSGTRPMEVRKAPNER